MQTFHTVIKCPECGKIQNAKVELTEPFSTYIHICKNCEYTIMESEWDVVELSPGYESILRVFGNIVYTYYDQKIIWNWDEKEQIVKVID